MKNESSKTNLDFLGQAVVENLPSLTTNPMLFLTNIATSMAIHAATEMTDHNLGLARNRAASLAIDALPIPVEKKEYIGNSFDGLTGDRNRLTDPSEASFEQTHHSIVASVAELAMNTVPGKSWMSPDSSEKLLEFFKMGMGAYEIFAEKVTKLWGQTRYTVSTAKDGAQIGERWIAEVTSHAPLIHELLTAFAFGTDPSPIQEFRIRTPGLRLIHNKEDGTEIELTPRSSYARQKLLEDIIQRNIGTSRIQDALANLKSTREFSKISVLSKTGPDGNTEHRLTLSINLGQLDNNLPLPVSAEITINDTATDSKIIALLTGNALLGDQQEISLSLEEKLKELGLNAEIIRD